MTMIYREGTYELFATETVKGLGQHRLLSRVSFEVGLAIIVKGSEVTSSREPTQVEISEADSFYVGGVKHYISHYEANIIVAKLPAAESWITGPI